jgi:cell wall-associated NlpC family hydrolase
MSEPSYFDDEAKTEALAKEALSWLNTPFRPYFQIPQKEGEPKQDTKGIGIDCVGLVQEVLARTGSMEDFLFPRTMADYQEHQMGDKILDWVRGNIDDPQSKRLKELFVELDIPAVFTDPDAESPMNFFKPGDVLVLKHGSLFHMPIIYDEYLHFVNAVPRMGVIEGTLQDSTFSIHLVAAFRLRPKIT